MRPEDIDKLFRDQLEQHVTPPPPGLWYDLQDRLEPEERKRRGGFWMYAVAAAVTLLLVAGTGWLLWRPSTPQGSAATGELASATQPAAPAHTPAAQPAGPNSPELLASAPHPNSATTPAVPADAAAETAPTYPANPDSFTPTPAARQREAIRMAARTARPVVAPEQPSAPRSPAQPEMVAAVPTGSATTSQLPSSATPVPAPVVGGQALAAAGAGRAPQGTIEVEVRESPELPAVAAVATTEPELTRRSRLLGVVKQVGRVVRGEKPNLTEVGLPANPGLTVQARIGSHTLSKTISL
ncbi:hypothetical protein F0P96_18885 [Hymenobacter busanensis]|uniref:Uncharacterized protein n=1 Tax=Hymenobacter busanensis TaxID=2607656 RepID=A0A7L4ZU39_9BACT|nr:hypothetical protein [Hymenobacter busanensis]KAA9325834.1 hypothetical protein F0P96_18885 [Hymenobacter busanensis]QHJ06326.1 hypothetical protein GUY19_03040 [Hymenobacter busanensis]